MKRHYLKKRKKKERKKQVHVIPFDSFYERLKCFSFPFPVSFSPSRQRVSCYLLAAAAALVELAGGPPQRVCVGGPSREPRAACHSRAVSRQRERAPPAHNAHRRTTPASAQCPPAHNARPPLAPAR